jgi:hypothetical protein
MSAEATYEFLVLGPGVAEDPQTGEYAELNGVLATVPAEPEPPTNSACAMSVGLTAATAARMTTSLGTVSVSAARRP